MTEVAYETPQAVIRAATWARVQLWLEDGQLVAEAESAPPEAVLEGLSAHKSGIAAILARGPDPRDRRVVMAIQRGARRHGAVAISSRLGATVTYALLDRLIAQGSVRQAPDGELSLASPPRRPPAAEGAVIANTKTHTDRSSQIVQPDTQSRPLRSATDRTEDRP